MEVHLLPLIKKCCKTCPFKENDKGIWGDVDLANKVIERNLFKSQQTCHSSSPNTKEDTMRCRGYFDYSFDIYKKMGLEPEKHMKNIS